MAPSESAEFAAAAGSASSVDERTLRTLLMRQPAAQELGLTDDALMDSFVRSCAVSSKPSPDSPSSVVSPGPRARYTCAQYLRVVADLSQYGHDVRLGTLLVGNGRSVLQSNAGGLVDNHGAVVRFNDYQTEGFAKHVGTKTTLWVLSDWVCIKLINKYPARTVPILICIPFKFMGKPYYASRRAELEADLTPEQRRRVRFITSDTAEDLIQRYSFGDRWPSSGLLTIWHFVHAPRAQQPSPPLLLLGFDFFKEIDGKIHYMEDDCKANHHASQEERCCRDLCEAGHLAFLVRAGRSRS